MSKAEKKTAVFYDQQSHYLDQSQAFEAGQVFKGAKNNLEEILKKEIDYTAFRKDILGYSLSEIKKAFPKPFKLGLTDEATLKMLSIDLNRLKEADAFLKFTSIKFCVCPKTGDTSPDEDREPYISYAVNDDQHQRLNFCNELISVLNKAHEYIPHKAKYNLVLGLESLIYLDPQRGVVPNHNFVLEGVQ